MLMQMKCIDKKSIWPAEMLEGPLDVDWNVGREAVGHRIQAEDNCARQDWARHAGTSSHHFHPNPTQNHCYDQQPISKYIFITSCSQ